MKVGQYLKQHWLPIGFVVCALGGAAGIWALLHPAAFWLQPWRPEASAESRFIFGPYPIEADFKNLQKEGVTTIISLLDSDLPYEKVLLGQETELARQHGMRVLNFPMASILGRSFGKDYVANSKAAAAAAIDSKGVVYLHCYLGLHRAANVRKILKTYAETEGYAGTRKSTRSPDQIALERAGMAFRHGDMNEVLREIASMQVKSDGALRLEAWASYRLNRTEVTRNNFSLIVSKTPDDPEALGGLGYSALRCDDLEAAADRFLSVLAKHPDDASALEGLGHVRYRQDRGDEAKALFEHVLKVAPDSPESQELLDRLQTVPLPSVIATCLLLLGFATLAAEARAVEYVRRSMREGLVPRHWRWVHGIALCLALMLGIGSYFSGYTFATSEIHGVPFPWGGVNLGEPYGGGPSKALPTAVNFVVWFFSPWLPLAFVAWLHAKRARDS